VHLPYPALPPLCVQTHYKNDRVKYHIPGDNPLRRREGFLYLIFNNYFLYFVGKLYTSRIGFFPIHNPSLPIKNWQFFKRKLYKSLFYNRATYLITITIFTVEGMSND